MALLIADGLLTDEQLKAIGHVAIESATLEALLENLMCHVLGLGDQARAALVDRLQLSAKLQTYRVLVGERIKDAGVLKKFTKLCDTHTSAVDRRNKLIHGRWIHRRNQLGDFEAIAQKRGKLAIKADEALRVANDLAAFRDELGHFHLLHGDELSASQ